MNCTMTILFYYCGYFPFFNSFYYEIIIIILIFILDFEHSKEFVVLLCVLLFCLLMISLPERLL